MALSNTNFSLSSIDPDTLKQSFIAYLQGQPLFQDYNYSGSNINALLDVLSRNSFLNSFLINMAFAESMLDSAQLRDSIVSISKMLNYLPTSVTSSVSTISLSIRASSGNTFIMPPGTSFNTVNANGSYTFITDKIYLATSTNGTFFFPNVTIYEGHYVQDSFTVDTSINNQLFTLSDPLIDTSSLKVMVSENQGAVNNFFLYANNIYNISGNSNVFYLQGTSNNQYQFQFGDGILGYRPQSGSLVLASYRVSFGDTADGANSFNLTYNLGGYNSTNVSAIVVNTLSTSAGGSQAEDLESIRFNAPRCYQSMEHAVVATDYKNLILKNFPQIGDVNVYGGNVNSNGVNYGTAYISMVSPSGNPVTQTNKDIIVSFLKDRNVLPVQIETVDANNIWLSINSKVHVDFTQTALPIAYFQATVFNIISSFSNTSLQKYNTPFRLSKLSDAISGQGNSAIISDESYFSMRRYTPVKLNTNNNILLSFNNPIINVTSSRFSQNGLSCVIADVYPSVNISNGTLSIITFNGNNNIISSNTIGMVNHANGFINIPVLEVDNFLNNVTTFYFDAYPQNKDIYANNNDLFKIDTISGINVTIVSG